MSARLPTNPSVENRLHSISETLALVAVLGAAIGAADDLCLSDEIQQGAYSLVENLAETAFEDLAAVRAALAADKSRGLFLRAPDLGAGEGGGR